MTWSLMASCGVRYAVMTLHSLTSIQALRRSENVVGDAEVHIGFYQMATAVGFYVPWDQRVFG